MLAEVRLEVLLHEIGIDFEFVSVTPQSAEALLRARYLNKDEDSAIIVPAAAAAMLSFRCPEQLARLLETSRVALIDGAVSLPFAQAPSATVDLVAVDWEEVTEQIARNVANRTVYLEQRTVFEARAYLRVPLCECAQSS